MSARCDSGCVLIRDDRPEDEAAIAIVVRRAFGREDEAKLVEMLRADGDAAISLVALAGDQVAGHVMFSRMSAPFRALGLAPLSVSPEYQGRGVGRSLVEEGLKRAAGKGWQGVFVLGDAGYYERFGFRGALAAGFESPYAGPHLMAFALNRDLPMRVGQIAYPRAFQALGL